MRVCCNNYIFLILFHRRLFVVQLLNNKLQQLSIPLRVALKRARFDLLLYHHYRLMICLCFASLILSCECTFYVRMINEKVSKIVEFILDRETISLFTHSWRWNEHDLMPIFLSPLSPPLTPFTFVYNYKGSLISRRMLSILIWSLQIWRTSNYNHLLHEFHFSPKKNITSK